MANKRCGAFGTRTQVTLGISSVSILTAALFSGGTIFKATMAIRIKLKPGRESRRASPSLGIFNAIHNIKGKPEAVKQSMWSRMMVIG